ncbi:MAG: hypothetical protein Hyperionvirus32_1, partial [Hyperionvirus sp.]
MEILTDEGRWVDSSHNHLVFIHLLQPYDLNA